MPTPQDTLDELLRMSRRLADPALDYVMLGEGNTSAGVDAGTFYGVGLMAFDVPDGDKRLQWLGHAGGAPGAGALVIYSPEDKAFVAVALTGDGPATAAVNAVVKAWQST